MENQRLIPLIMLGLIAFLLWTNWSEFQQQRQQEVVQSRPAAPAAGPSLATGNTVDVPHGLLNDEQARVTPSLEQTTPGQASAGQIIRVVTDTFIAEIDTKGGTLRRVDLPTYPVDVNQPNVPYTLMDDSRNKVFTIQSGLLASEGKTLLPDHHALYSAAASEYRLQDGQDSLQVPLTWQDDQGRQVVKQYRFYRGRFDVTLDHQLSNTSDQPLQVTHYRQMVRTPPKDTPSLLGGVYTYTGGVISTPESPYEKIDFGDMGDQDLSQTVKGGWQAMIQHYFLAALIPNEGETNRFYSKVDGNRYFLGMLDLDLTPVPAQGTANFTTTLYVGPKLQDRLAALAPYLDRTVDYGFLHVLSAPLFWVLEKIHDIVGNWGWSIILLTLMIKLVFYKLSETSYRSMAGMRQLGPKLTRLKETYGDDRQALNQKMMELYKKEKINPLGGCLPILVQIPVFIALYWMLLESVELRQAPWMFWIHDLSTKDPYYILPVIMGVTMFLQQKLSPAPADPMQAKVMMALPFLFTFFFLWFPSGLVLYWVVNNSLSILQQYIITKRVESGKDKIYPTGPTFIDRVKKLTDQVQQKRNKK